MRKPTAVAILFLLAAAGSIGAAEKYVYELQVAGKKHAVTLGERFEIPLPGGRPFAILRFGPATWSGHGIRFSHPGDMKVRAIDHGPATGIRVVTINVGRDDSLSVMMALRPPGKKTPEEALAGAVEGLRMGAKRKNEAELKSTPWEEEVAGEVRKGVRLTPKSGDNPSCSGVVAFPFAGRVLVIGCRAPRARWDEALAAFRTVAASLAVDKGEKQTAPALELKIESHTYPIELDRALTIKGPDGKEFTATLRRGRKDYVGTGIEFEYPGDMIARTEKKTQRVMIHVEHGEAYFASLQIYLVPGMEREKVQSITVRSVRSNVEGTGARFGPEKVCRRRFLGKSRSGTLLVTEGGDDPHQIEIYSFGIGKRMVSVLFYCRGSNTKTAKKAFLAISKSFGEVK